MSHENKSQNATRVDLADHWHILTCPNVYGHTCLCSAKSHVENVSLVAWYKRATKTTQKTNIYVSQKSVSTNRWWWKLIACQVCDLEPAGRQINPVILDMHTMCKPSPLFFCILIFSKNLWSNLATLSPSSNCFLSCRGINWILFLIWARQKNCHKWTELYKAPNHSI